MAIRREPCRGGGAVALRLQQGSQIGPSPSSGPTEPLQRRRRASGGAPGRESVTGPRELQQGEGLLFTLQASPIALLRNKTLYDQSQGRRA